MKTYIKQIAFLLLITLSFSCSNDDDNKTDSITDVYVTGMVLKNGTVFQATLWKNEEEIPLTNGDTTRMVIELVKSDLTREDQTS